MKITVKELQLFLKEFDPEEEVSFLVDDKLFDVEEMFGELDPKIILSEVDDES